MFDDAAIDTIKTWEKKHGPQLWTVSRWLYVSPLKQLGVCIDLSREQI